MFSFEASNVYEAGKPLHKFSGFLGLTSFTLKQRDGIFIAQKTIFSYACVILYSVWSATFIIFFMMIDLREIWGQDDIFISEIQEKTIIFTIATSLLISATINWWMFLNRNKFPRIFKLLLNIDEELVKLNVALDHKTHKKRVIFSIAIVQCLTLLFVFLSHLNASRRDDYHTDGYSLFSMCYFIEFQAFIFLQFIFLIWTVKLRLEKLNIFLRKSLSKVLTESAIDENINLNQVAKLHDKLVDVSEAINRCYGFPVRDKFIEVYIMKCC